MTETTIQFYSGGGGGGGGFLPDGGLKKNPKNKKLFLGGGGGGDGGLLPDCGIKTNPNRQCPYAIAELESIRRGVSILPEAM